MRAFVPVLARAAACVKHLFFCTMSMTWGQRPLEAIFFLHKGWREEGKIKGSGEKSFCSACCVDSAAAASDAASVFFSIHKMSFYQFC